MARKAKAAAAKSRILGGVNAADTPLLMAAKAIAATIEKRAPLDGDERFRLRLSKSFELRCGEKLLLDGEFETALAIVAAVHPYNLVDVVVRGGLFDRHAEGVHVRRASL